MHSYLRAIGFSNLSNRKELEKIIGMVIDQPTKKSATKEHDKRILSEIKKSISENMGIAIRGEFDEKGVFHLEHYFPYFDGHMTTLREEVVMNKRVDTDAYTGMCDDLRLGVSLIFYVQNAIDYINNKDRSNNKVLPITLAGLSIEGKVLLGINTNKELIENQTAQMKQRNQLITEARAGSQEAIDSLTIDDIDMYAMISRRTKREDIYSIVDNSFIPYGSESDNYSIVGTILDWKIVNNQITQEEVYSLYISCNDLDFNVCINKKDMEGEPMVGRRFKGNIWMQGFVDFENL
jgi:hypothetical protein